MKEKIKHPSWRLVSHESFSSCGISLEKLDFDNWWLDDSGDRNYLHVKKIDEDTYWRVFCKRCKKPRIGTAQGKLYWIY